jgi:glutamine amidotransferase
MIAIIDYDGGNYKSVINILNRSRIKFILTNNEKEISKCKKIILPGVSNFDYCMKKLKLLNLDKILYDAVIVNKKKILGICSGMQVLG